MDRPLLDIKICSIQYPERYAVRRLVMLAGEEIKKKVPSADINITEISDPIKIGQYSFCIVLSTLVINEKAVCSGRFPSREEVVAWLQGALNKEEVR